jgi:hypothetical protein
VCILALELWPYLTNLSKQCTWCQSGIYRYLTKQLMKKNSCWQANSHSTSQKIPRHSWNPKAQYRVHKSPPMISILSRMNQSTNSHTHLSKIYYKHIISAYEQIFRVVSSFRFWDQNYVCISHIHHAFYMTRPFSINIYCCIQSQNVEVSSESQVSSLKWPSVKAKSFNSDDG